MKKLLLVFIALFPYFLNAQVIATHADSVAAHQNEDDSDVQLSKEDIAFLRSLPPRPNKLVADYTNTLTDKQVNLLELKLEAFGKATTDQVAVVIIKSTGADDVMLYGRKLAYIWRIGQKGKDNGVLVLVAINDKKTAILTGRNFEGTLTDLICHNIIETDLVPNFKKHDYYTGLDQCTNDLIKYINGEK